MKDKKLPKRCDKYYLRVTIFLHVTHVSSSLDFAKIHENPQSNNELAIEN